MGKQSGGSSVTQTPPGTLSPDIQAVQHALSQAAQADVNTYAPFSNWTAAQLYPGSGWGGIAPSGSFGPGTTPGPLQPQGQPSMQGYMPSWMQQGLQSGPAQSLYGPAGNLGGMPPPASTGHPTLPPVQPGHLPPPTNPAISPPPRNLAISPPPPIRLS